MCLMPSACIVRLAGRIGGDNGCVQPADNGPPTPTMRQSFKDYALTSAVHVTSNWAEAITMC
jgi:hypothetical protein